MLPTDGVPLEREETLDRLLACCDAGIEGFEGALDPIGGITHSLPSHIAVSYIETAS